MADADQARSIPDFAKGGGLISAIAQDVNTREVLMIAWMNQEAFEQTLATNTAVYYSRSRKALWRKGEQSGHVQRVKEIRVDCDADAILLLVEQQGAACHEGYSSCFFRKFQGDELKVDRERLVDPKDVY